MQNEKHSETTDNSKSSYATRLTMMLGIPALTAVISLIHMIADSLFLTIILVLVFLFLLLYIPVEKVVNFLARRHLEKAVRGLRWPFISVIVVLVVLGIAFDILHVGDYTTKSVFPQLAWPLYYDRTFAGDATLDRHYVKNYKGFANVAKLSFQCSPTKTGYGGWIIGVGGLPLPRGAAKLLTPNRDMSRFTYLSFVIRGATAGEVFNLKAKDMHGTEEVYRIQNIPDTKWLGIEVNLRETFPNVDFANLDNISLSTSDVLTGKRAEIYVANIALW